MKLSWSCISDSDFSTCLFVNKSTTFCWQIPHIDIQSYLSSVRVRVPRFIFTKHPSLTPPQRSSECHQWWEGSNLMLKCMDYLAGCVRKKSCIHWVGNSSWPLCFLKGSDVNHRLFLRQEVNAWNGVRRVVFNGSGWNHNLGADVDRHKRKHVPFFSNKMRIWGENLSLGTEPKSYFSCWKHIFYDGNVLMISGKKPFFVVRPLFLDGESHCYVMGFVAQPFLWEKSHTTSVNEQSDGTSTIYTLVN